MTNQVNTSQGASTERKPAVSQKQVKIKVIVYEGGQPTGRTEVLRRPTRAADLMRSMNRQPSEID